jgi:light-regulated signal transduction histidine kinase (bacteriophytochrome)
MGTPQALIVTARAKSKNADVHLSIGYNQFGYVKEPLNLVFRSTAPQTPETRSILPHSRETLSLATSNSPWANLHMLLSHDAISPLTQEGLLHRIANQVRQSLELESILSTTAAEIRAYLGTDRVKIYQFCPDGHGVVVAESLQADRLPSLLRLHFPADDIPRYARELFVRARQRAIVDLGNHQIGLSPLNCPETGAALNTIDIRYRPVDPCHQEYLTAMGVKSSIVVPIVLEGEASGFYDPPSLPSSNHLWGLLVSHHAEPRSVTEAELQFIQAVVDQVAVAIAQSVLLEQVRTQARREANMNQVTARLQMSPTVDWQEALELAAHTLSAGSRLYLASETDSPREIYAYGEQPASSILRRIVRLKRIYYGKNICTLS